MGGQMVMACLRADASSSTQKLVLLALAGRHNEETGQCDPSTIRLMEECHLGNKAVSNAIKDLEQAGFITVNRRFGARSSYTLHPNIGPQLGDKPVSLGHGSGDEPVSEGHGCTSKPMAQKHGFQSKPVSLTPKPVSQGHTNRKNRKKNNSSENLSDPRHHEVMSQWSARLKSALGIQPTVNGRDASALSLLLKQVEASAEDILTIAEKAWRRQSEGGFCPACSSSVELHKFCQNWTRIQAEIQQPIQQNRSRGPQLPFGISKSTQH